MFYVTSTITHLTAHTSRLALFPFHDIPDTLKYLDLIHLDLDVPLSQLYDTIEPIIENFLNKRAGRLKLRIKWEVSGKMREIQAIPGIFPKKLQTNSFGSFSNK